jgi:hypothetical protein
MTTTPNADPFRVGDVVRVAERFNYRPNQTGTVTALDHKFRFYPVVVTWSNGEVRRYSSLVLEAVEAKEVAA